MTANDNDKVNILMVDDQPAKLLSYEVMLGELGENLIKTHSGREALEQLLKTDVAVVLMDVNMPEMDGFELADLIRQHPRFQKTAIIFISAVHLTDVDRIKGYQRGAVDYISVPVVPELLRAKVSVFAELHRKTRQLERLNHELERRVAQRTEELKERADLLELASEAIMVRNSDGILDFWNRGAEAVYGWKREEVLGKNVSEILQTQLPVPLVEIEAHLATEGRWDGNLVQRTKDGRELAVASRQALKSDGLRHGILEINRDITARLKAEESLRLRTAQFETLLSAAPLGVYVVDADFCVREVNPTAISAFGNIPDLIGRDFGEVIHIIWPKDYADEVVRIFRHTLDTGEPYMTPELIYERLDRGVTEYYAWQISRIPLPEGQYGVVCYFRDISTEVLARQKISASEERLRFVMESMPQKIFTANADGAVDYFNRQWMEFTGLSFEQIRDWGWMQFIHPADVEENVRVWKHSIQTGEPFRFEHRFLRKDGSYRWHFSSALPFRDEGGNILMWIGCNTDVHDQKQSEETLLKTEKLAAVGRLAATMAHEINNPLESVTNLLYLIKKDASLSKQSLSHLQLADQELDRVAHIAKQTLGFYRDNSAPNWLDVGKTIDELLAVYSYRFRNRDIKIEKDLEACATVFASAGEFRQVFSNLFVNAVDAILDRGGKILVRVRASQDWSRTGRRGVRVSVGDNGCGIGQKHRDRIFEPFYTTKEDVGTGLGLWLSRTVVQKYDGYIRVRSQVQPGSSGTVFSVFWPQQAKAELEVLTEKEECEKIR